MHLQPLPLLPGPLPFELPPLPPWLNHPGPQQLQGMVTSLIPPCPLGCTTAFSTERMLIAHLERVHLRSQQTLPDSFLREFGKWVCKPCGRLLSKQKKTCVACQRDPRGSRVWELEALPGPSTICTPFTAPKPQLYPALEDILTADINTYLHIPPRARDDVALTLARVIREFVALPGWETLQRLLAFPKVVLQPLDRGGKSHWGHVGRVVQNKAQLFYTTPLRQ